MAKGSGSATKVGRSHPGPYLLKGSPGLLHRGHVPKLLAALAAPPREGLESHSQKRCSRKPLDPCNSC